MTAPGQRRAELGALVFVVVRRQQHRTGEGQPRPQHTDSPPPHGRRDCSKPAGRPHGPSGGGAKPPSGTGQAGSRRRVETWRRSAAPWKAPATARRGGGGPAPPGVSARTVGHNIQYHCIVYSYARNKYADHPEPAFRWARALFRSVPVYAAAGLLFTFALYRGPLIDWFRDAMGGRLDQVAFNSLAMMAGIRDPAAPGIGEQVLAALLLGFAMQHYYLDAKIWRVGADREVRKYLKV